MFGTLENLIVFFMQKSQFLDAKVCNMPEVRK